MEQILWINIIMDGPPAQSLGVEPVHGAIVQRPPRKASDPVISSRLMWRVLSSGALIVVGTLWVFSLGMIQVRELGRVFPCYQVFGRACALQSLVGGLDDC